MHIKQLNIRAQPSFNAMKLLGLMISMGDCLGNCPNTKSS